MGGIWKSTFREIKASFGRFMAIFAIIALGVGFFAGLKVTKEAMVSTVKGYLDNHAFYDYRLLSTLGFVEDDVDSLLIVGDVDEAEGAISFDVLYRLEDGSQGVVKTHSITERVNTLKLVSGRMPQNDDECAIDGNMLGESAIGSVIYLSEDNEEDGLENFTYREYTVVGIVQSPLYLQYERGNTSLGTGRLDGYVYLTMGGFRVDYYTEIYVRFVQDYAMYSEEYDAFLKKKNVVWEKLVRKMAAGRYQDIVGEADGELADARAELAQKRAEGEAELAEAEAKLADGAKQLADGEKQIADGEQALADAWTELRAGERTLRRSEAELAEARRTIDEKNGEIASGEEAVAKTEARIQEIRDVIDQGEKELWEGERQLAEGKAQYNSNLQMVQQMRPMLAEAKRELAQQEAELASLRRSLENRIPEDLKNTNNGDGDSGDGNSGDGNNEGGSGGFIPGDLPDSPKVEEYKSMITGFAGDIFHYIESLEKSIAKYRKEIDQMEKDLNYAEWELARAETQLANGEEELKSGWDEIRDARNQLTDGRFALSEGKLELVTGRMAMQQAEKQLADGERTIASSQKELKDAKATLSEKEAELSDARQELSDARQELADGEAEYLDALEEFNRRIKEAEEEIADAQRQIDEIKEPDTYVLGRDTNIGYVCFENDSNIIEGIANIFPILFFLVAALVCITTMNRMVEEQRIQIGVLKALGFGEAVIMAKYMIYSGTAAVAGCIFGFFVGTWGFPKVIWLCYGIMYNADPISFLFDGKLAVISLAVSLLCSVGTTWMSCRLELGQVAATLMRPKAPKAGKRVLLEYIPFLWRHLSFLRKVSLRNIFRYKKRLFMMVVGISGCTGLLVTGFGIKDSIADVATRQFEEIQTYDIEVTLKDEADQTFREELEGLMESGIAEYTCLMEKNMNLVTGDAVKSMNLVAGRAEEMGSFLDLHTEQGEGIAYPAKGEAVISNKLAKDYDVGIGDRIVVRDEEMNSFSVTVAGIYENYIYNYVHISQDTWRELMGEEPERRTVYINLAEGADAYGLSAELMKSDRVANVTVNADTMARMENMLKSLDIIVVVVIFCAAGLAFIVLYNLTNINITERVREIATIKVLGFYKKETAAYVFRENFMLTALGMGLGLGLGYFMHKFVIAQIQVDLMYFTAYVKPESYLYSGLLTFGFAWLVNKTMGGKLEGISMTESLKSVD